MTLSLVCKRFRSVLTDPFLYFPSRYLAYYMGKNNAAKVRELTDRITKPIDGICIYVWKQVQEYLYNFAFSDERCTIVESVFLHDVLWSEFTAAQHRDMLHRMVLAGKFDYLMKALKRIDFQWEQKNDDNPDSRFYFPFGHPPFLRDILVIVLTGERATLDDKIRVLPILFELEPRLYQCISLWEGDPWTFPERSLFVSSKIKNQLNEGLRPTFQRIVDNKKDWVQRQVEQGLAPPGATILW